MVLIEENKEKSVSKTPSSLRREKNSGVIMMSTEKAHKLKQSAFCEFDSSTNSYSIGGIVLLKPREKSIHIFGEIVSEKLNGTYHLQIHKYGDIRDNCSKTGEKFNPLNKKKHKSHAAHISNFTFIENTARLNLTYKNLAFYGEASVLGRSMVIHSDSNILGANDTQIKKSRNATMIACCSILLRS
ncbi:CuZn superoxide dismutase-like protein [Dinothrombium tinctorium]|uniref:CuZn superoxide dismutase-like protein n=1 Tax=Dinothrombium tinctorium TaxID=1965070 RepID=A0A3S3RV67_9ACAR|nr:CuZn superoxide dismutase-like protein [Dinothrombium tinctorium]RWS06486.1 CuZn superoxide dismutase-like protein [Dinothrombium tinctorium]RWS13621.1 CuZn superoxide dismutase-like protein [Dinothrombium tinctorium]